MSYFRPIYSLISHCYTWSMSNIWSRLIGSWRRLWELPSAQDPPRRSWRDWLLACVLIAASLLEWLFYSFDVEWRPVVFSVAIAAPLATPWARAFPLHAIAIVFVAYGALHLAMLVAGVESRVVNPFTLLVLTHFLVRWGSGRHIAIGLGIVAVCWIVVVSTHSDSLAGTIFETILIALPVFSGAAMRRSAELRRARDMEVRLKERNRIARDLHDTIAHRMTAIAIQAQAGRAVAASDQGAVVETLTAIEDTASSSLREMRKMIGVLRDSGAAPGLRHTIAEIGRIANSVTGEIPVNVELRGELGDLEASIEAGLFWVAQEAITNARRHSRRASRISVLISESADAVHLTVTDDGDPVRSGANAGSGYGIIGMTERTALLSGRLRAGPGSSGHWVVEVFIPKRKG